MNKQINQNEINVGVDTGKTQLDIYIRPLDIYFVVTNDESGIKEAINEIKKHKVTRVVIEAIERLHYSATATELVSKNTVFGGQLEFFISHLP